jgi:hypothetical protein
MGNIPPSGPDSPGSGGSGQPDWSEMKGKLTAAGGDDRMILIAGLVFFIDSFLPWYGFRISFGGVGIGANISGWSSGGLAVLAIVFALLATVFATLRVLGVKLDLGTVKDGVVYLALGGGALLFAVLRFVTETSLTKYGLYVAIVAGVFLALGGWRKFSATKS